MPAVTLVTAAALGPNAWPTSSKDDDHRLVRWGECYGGLVEAAAHVRFPASGEAIVRAPKMGLGQRPGPLWRFRPTSGARPGTAREPADAGVRISGSQLLVEFGHPSVPTDPLWVALLDPEGGRPHSVQTLPPFQEDGLGSVFMVFDIQGRRDFWLIVEPMYWLDHYMDEGRERLHGFFRARFRQKADDLFQQLYVAMHKTHMRHYDRFEAPFFAFAMGRAGFLHLQDIHASKPDRERIEEGAYTGPDRVLTRGEKESKVAVVEQTTERPEPPRRLRVLDPWFFGGRGSGPLHRRLQKLLRFVFSGEQELHKALVWWLDYLVVREREEESKGRVAYIYETYSDQPLRGLAGELRRDLEALDQEGERPEDAVLSSDKVLAFLREMENQGDETLRSCYPTPEAAAGILAKSKKLRTYEDVCRDQLSKWANQVKKSVLDWNDREP